MSTPEPIAAAARAKETRTPPRYGRRKPSSLQKVRIRLPRVRGGPRTSAPPRSDAGHRHLHLVLRLGGAPVDALDRRHVPVEAAVPDLHVLLPGQPSSVPGRSASSQAWVSTSTESAPPSSGAANR